jgi:CubicO group peptidase (beta-lactamase class C family)
MIGRLPPASAPMRLKTFLVSGLFALCVAFPRDPAVEAQSGPGALVWFEQYLDALRQQAGIPGLSAAIVGDGTIVWEGALGYEDVESSRHTRADTPYQIGDLTQMFAATLLLQCVERGTARVDDHIREYSDAIPEHDATLRHVLSHTSEGSPGVRFRYDPARYRSLGSAIDICGDDPYRLGLATEIFDRLGMGDSVPGEDLARGEGADLFDGGALGDYERTLSRMATPYRSGRDRPAPSGIGPVPLTSSSGLVSSVRDLARFDAALDDRALLSGESLALAWSNAGSRGSAPAGLGWFVQYYRGEHVVWHFGLVPDGYSALYLKVPDRGLTLILLANSDGLSSGFSLDRGDVTSSPFARLFLQLFI